MTEEVAEPSRAGLSKSRYVIGLQCPKLLWWTVNEPKAPELAPDPRLQTIFTRGQRVGALAREQVPGGVLIDVPHNEFSRRVAATAQAIAEGARVIYEASFLQDGIFVAVDILERRRHGFVLTEVKSTLDVKDEHLPDVAVQVHVLRRAGIQVARAEVMHLNRECRFPDLSNLFVRTSVTSRLRRQLRAVPGRAAALIRQLEGPLPEVRIGSHCQEPYECPFLERCWPKLPEHHVSKLYRIRGSQVEKLQARGVDLIEDLDPEFAKSAPARRQIESLKRNELIVERGLRRALKALRPPLAFLDFETIAPAIPVWPGCRPYEPVPVQFSCHVVTLAGVRHHEWLAEGPQDPREDFAKAVIDSCRGAKTVLAYNAPFERGRLAALAKALPRYRAKLTELSNRIRDLLPIVRDHVYDPAFGGSFSIKDVLPALVGGGYGDLAIQDGSTASAGLEELLLDGAALPEGDRQALRGDLKRYCEQDTRAMVDLHKRLCELASLQAPRQARADAKSA